MSKKKNRKIKKRRLLIPWVILDKSDLAKDIVVSILALGILIFFVVKYLQAPKNGENIAEATVAESEISAGQEIATPTVDTTNWQSYQSQTYAFELKYPDEWQKPQVVKPSQGDSWIYKYQFRKTTGGNGYDGFDVAVYSVKKVGKIDNTQEYPTYKFNLNENETCRFIPPQVRNEPNFYAVEMYVSPEDDCYKQTFFYSFIRDEYIYNIVPVRSDGQPIQDNIKNDVADNFPEFFSAVSSFNLITVAKAAPKPAGPGPIGVGTHCPAKNDRPSVSSRKSRNHMDEDCCSDFDEWPKPGCFYTAKDYVIMLSGPTSGHVKR